MKNKSFSKYTRVFPQPREMREGKETFIFGNSTTLVVPHEGIRELAILLQELLYERIGIKLPIENRQEDISQPEWHLLITNDAKTDHDIAAIAQEDAFRPESYALSISSQGASLLGSDRAGTIYGMQTLLALMNKNEKNDWILPGITIRDWPEFSRRGVHLYLPPRESIEGFKRIIRTLAFLKMNLLIIEVGGGMELEHHPEINRDWERFCREAYAFPGGPQGLQRSQAYWKDSTHPELAGGSYLTKAEVRDIVQYAKRLGMDVVPEIQALSHTYYLCYSHKEIAERPQEPFPDTFCPSSPDSFKLYFEVAAEIIEVFEPSMVSIGLDEVRILGECPRCRDKTGHELLTAVIVNLHDFYTTQGIRIMMWAEKLQNFIGYDGIARGGVFEERTDMGGYWRVPATYEAIDRIPKDILMLDWYHSLGHETESEFIEKGFPVMFGNFDASLIADWKKRSRHDGFLGAEVSTWCRADEYTIGRNNEMYQIVFSAGALWTGGNEDAAWDEADQTTISVMPVVKSMMQNGESALIAVNPTDFVSLYLPEQAGQGRTPEPLSLPVQEVKWMQGSLLKDIFTGSDEITRIPPSKEEIKVKVEGRMESLIFIHAAAKSMGYCPSWCFLDMSKYKLGRYDIQYEDDSSVAVNIQYGIHIGNIDMDWGRYRSIGDDVRQDVEQAGVQSESVPESLPPYYKMADDWRGSLMYFTIPVKLRTGEGMKTGYAYEWRNPYPEKRIQSVRWVSNAEDKLQSVIIISIAGARIRS